MLMVLSCTARYLLSLALLILAATAYDGQPEGHSGGGSATPSNINECEAHTINYITHTLPQLCPTSTWRSATDGKGDAHDDGEATPTVSSPRFNSTTTTTTDSNSGGPTDPVVSSTNNNGAEPTEAAAEKSGDSSFMSFEDWKEMMLRQTGQDPQDLRSRKATSSQGRVRDPPDMGHYGLGEEDEISLDFEKYLNQEKADTPSSVAPSTDEASGVQPGDAIQDGERPFLHLSKDAGKTCKERFSYSSFDAGATILKTGRSTKNAKAILVENKDSYMLLECSVDSKYVIVELSDDVLIDTVVLANFEFFSSMIRHFRVSVSDRYPVKLERWRDIGTFEARNSRDVQAFLIENPQIWAKYVRIEFLTHYGNEFYCPVSLLRIHGSRMLDSWKDTETIRDEELQIEAEESARAASLEIETRKEANIEATKDSSDLEKPETRLNFTLWEISPTVIFGQFCLYDYTSTNEAQDGGIAQLRQTTTTTTVEEPNQDRVQKGEEDDKPAASSTQPKQSGSHQNRTSKPSSTTTPTMSTNTPVNPRPSTESNSTFGNSTASTETPGNHTTPTTRPSTTVTPGVKHRNPGTGGASTASPPVQEGFFNAITKRLQNVESNLTLSLQYLEDHSKYMQEAFHQGEQKQLSKVANFLDTLNETVMAEMRGMRDQYDQIWQSTVFALESQKKQADRDIVALSSRLNLLADEVVFQKRMAIVQAVLLLCCLFLVIFSRGVPISYLAPLMDQHGSGSNYSGPRSHRHASGMFVPGSENDLLENGATASRPLDGYAPGPSPDAMSTMGYGMDAASSHPGSQSAVKGTEDDDVLSTTAHISPPHTPPITADSSHCDVPASSFDLHATPRRFQAYQHSQSRKPLPALPEYPSPPNRPSSPR